SRYSLHAIQAQMIGNCIPHGGTDGGCLTTSLRPSDPFATASRSWLSDNYRGTDGGRRRRAQQACLTVRVGHMGRPARAAGSFSVTPTREVLKHHTLLVSSSVKCEL